MLDVSLRSKVVAPQSDVFFFEIVTYTWTQYSWARSQIFFVCGCTDFAWHDCSFIYFIFIKPWGSRTENDCIALLMCCIASLAYLKPLESHLICCLESLSSHSTHTVLQPGQHCARIDGRDILDKSKMWISLGAELPRGSLLTPRPPLSLLSVVCLCFNQPPLLDTTKDKATGIRKPTTQRCQLICSMLLDK